ncbi:glycosyltransferase family 2 protein [Blautia sp. HCP3S3_C4]|uniref:glycosyltransferase family 2 protein n=1 Tax=Blautia sp. HCP3S3_C4 TaxID=3438911 RepID=UPI003F89E24D
MVSVIIPIYNGERTMRRAIDSVLNQSYKDVQVILIDDGSTDNSLQIIQEYAEIDSRVEYISQKNGGQAAARNVGLKNARGEFILFVDCDDSLEPSAVADVTLCMEKNPYASFVLFGFNVYAGERLLRTPNPGDGYYTRTAGYKAFAPVEKLMASPCNKLYRREYIRVLFNESMVFGEDGYFNYSNLTNDTEVALCSKCLYNVQLGTEGSVNKRYKTGKLLDTLRERELQEMTCKEIFGSEFDSRAFQKRELSTISFTVYSCCIKLKKSEAIIELKTATEQSGYLAKMFDNLNTLRTQDKLILMPLKDKRYSLVIMICRLLKLIRKVVGR